MTVRQRDRDRRGSRGVAKGWIEVKRNRYLYAVDRSAQVTDYRATETHWDSGQPHSNSTRITTRLGDGRLTSRNPAASKTLRAPTLSSPQAISCPGAVSIA